MRVSAISPFARLRIDIHLDYSIVHGPESMPPVPAYAAPAEPPSSMTNCVFIDARRTPYYIA
jgi:hypothetical protein